MDQPTVLVISDDPEFSRLIMNRWQSERRVPAFSLMSSDIRASFDPENFQLAIAGHLLPAALSAVLETMSAAGKRVLFLAEDAATLETVRNRWPGIVVLRQQESWLDTLILIAAEALYSTAAEARASRAEKTSAVLEHEATLGRYVLDMRHTLNNALTSMLGNSELLLLEPGSLSAEARSQIETIRNMSLRIHEVLQRFSSLEKELRVVAQQARQEPGARVHAGVGA